MENKKAINSIEEFMKDMLSTVKAKSSDYNGDTSDFFKNFRACETSGLCSVEEGMLVRMFDKMNRIASLIKTSKQNVKDESVTDTLKDLANYSIILVTYIQSKCVKESKITTHNLSTIPDNLDFSSTPISKNLKVTQDIEKLKLKDIYPDKKYEILWHLQEILDRNNKLACDIIMKLVGDLYPKISYKTFTEYAIHLATHDSNKLIYEITKLDHENS